MFLFKKSSIKPDLLVQLLSEVSSPGLGVDNLIIIKLDDGNTVAINIENSKIDNVYGREMIDDTNWIESSFLPTVQQRGKAVIEARGASSATSAAKAALDTIIACENATAEGDCFSAAITSDGSYGVPEGLICGYPLITLEDGSVEIKRDIALSDFAKSKFKVSIDELLSEREAVQHLLS